MLDRRETALFALGLLLGLFLFVVDQATAHAPILKHGVEGADYPMQIENIVGPGSYGVELCPKGRMLITNYGYNTIHWRCIEQADNDPPYDTQPIPTRESRKL